MTASRRRLAGRSLETGGLLSQDTGARSESSVHRPARLNRHPRSIGVHSMRVGIVGLGLAGLRTAMLLERAGLDVSLFDARDRIGGRARTIEDQTHALH